MLIDKLLEISHPPWFVVACPCTGVDTRYNTTTHIFPLTFLQKYEPTAIQTIRLAFQKLSNALLPYYYLANLATPWTVRSLQINEVGFAKHSLNIKRLR